MTTRPSGDAGTILLTSLVRNVALLAIAGVVLLDGFSIARTQVSVGDDAQGAAQAAHTVLTTGGTHAKAAAAASLYARQHGATIPKGGVSFGAAYGSVTVTLHETASTLVAGRIGWLADDVTPSATATATSSAY